MILLSVQTKVNYFEVIRAAFINAESAPLLEFSPLTLCVILFALNRSCCEKWKCFLYAVITYRPKTTPIEDGRCACVCRGLSNITGEKMKFTVGHLWVNECILIEPSCIVQLVVVVVGSVMCVLLPVPVHFFIGCCCNVSWNQIGSHVQLADEHASEYAYENVTSFFE